MLVDRGAEKPEASTGGVNFVPTVQHAMRKSLRYPPLDTLVGGLAALAALVAVCTSNPLLLSEAMPLLASGKAVEAARLVASLAHGMS